jgi:hypothetical protein
MTTILRAWHVRCDGESGIVIARTPGRAKAIMWRAAKSVGIDADWKSVTVRRAKQFDGLALNRERGPYNPKYAEMMVQP